MPIIGPLQFVCFFACCILYLCYLLYKPWAPSHRVFKEPIHSELATLQVINELFETNEIGLWEIIKYARTNFGLIDNDLIEQVRKEILFYFRIGFEPVVAVEAGKYGWQLVNYGSTDEEKAASIIQEWLDSGRDPMFWNSLWFSPVKHVRQLSKKEPLGCINKIKHYPGKIYQLPNSIHLGIRQSNIGETVIEMFESCKSAHGSVDGIYWGIQWLKRDVRAIETLGPVSAHGSIVCVR